MFAHVSDADLRTMISVAQEKSSDARCTVLAATDNAPLAATALAAQRVWESARDAAYSEIASRSYVR
jgi:hypothetical protein